MPLWSTATIGGVPVQEWGSVGERPLDEEARVRMHRRVVSSAYEIIVGRGATSLAIGLAVSRILEAVLNDQHRVLPVTLAARRGPRPVRRVPVDCRPSSGGRVSRACWRPPLSDGERDQLVASAAAVRAVARDLGL